MARGDWSRPVDLLDLAHRYGERGRGELTPHLTELQVGVRMAFDGPRSRSLSSIWRGYSDADVGRYFQLYSNRPGLPAASIARWRAGGARPRSDNANALTRWSSFWYWSLGNYVHGKPTSAGAAKLRAIRRDGASAVFVGDVVIYGKLRRGKTLRVGTERGGRYMRPEACAPIARAGLAGDWAGALASLADAFWPAYFGAEGDAAELAPYFVHVDSLTIAPG